MKQATRKHRRETPATMLKSRVVMTATDYARTNSLALGTLMRWIRHGETLASGVVVRFPHIALANGKYLVCQGAIEQFAAELKAAVNGPTNAQARA